MEEEHCLGKPGTVTGTPAWGFMFACKETCLKPKQEPRAAPSSRPPLCRSLGGPRQRCLASARRLWSYACLAPNPFAPQLPAGRDHPFLPTLPTTTISSESLLTSSCLSYPKAPGRWALRPSVCWRLHNAWPHSTWPELGLVVALTLESHGHKKRQDLLAREKPGRADAVQAPEVNGCSSVPGEDTQCLMWNCLYLEQYIVTFSP